MAELASGTLIDGRYRVLSRLGSGGMADVFLAEDDQLGRKVALKLLHRRFAEDPDFVERFRREAQAAAGLQHPNIVGVYDRGAFEDTYYIAMEYLPGRSLKQLIRQEAPIDPLRAIDITIQMLKAARFAHRHGVIHRDLKPHNAIIDDAGHVKVTDFGIARAGASDMTETGSIMGTAQYLSPEQAQGHAVSASSDLYSIAVVLYEMLTGQVPFDAEAAVTIALKHVSEAPTEPTRINPSIPPELAQVVMWALNKDPIHRPATADDFIRALEQARSVIAAGEAGQRTASMAALVGVPVAAAAGPNGPSAAPPAPAYPPPVGNGDPLVAYETIPPYPPEPDRERSLWPWVALLVVLLLLAGGAAAYLLTRPQQRLVPIVVDQQVNDARTILENDGFGVNVLNVTSQKPAGIVIAQHPNGGSKVDKGSTVLLTVSSGPGNRPVPPVVGLPLKQAENQIRAAQLVVGRVIRQASSTYQAGQVTNTDPTAASNLPVGSRVTLFVSSGPAKVQVPDVTGETGPQAKSDLQNRGFSVSVVQQTTNDQTQVGNVVKQSPGGGTPLAPGTTVTIFVGKAAPPVVVPSTRGLTAAAATSKLRSAGFQVQQSTQSVTDPAKNGIVLHENPTAGTKAKKGSTVTIVVGQYSSTTSTTPTTPTSTTPTTPTTPGT